MGSRSGRVWGCVGVGRYVIFFCFGVYMLEDGGLIVVIDCFSDFSTWH